MKNLYIELHAKSPLAMRSDHAAGGAKTAPIVTGTTLLGSLASAHRLLRPEKKDEFVSLFLSEQVNKQVYYPNMYPACFDKSDLDLEASHHPVLPLPKTAQSCKRFPGFSRVPGEEEDNEDRHGVRDGLLDWAIFALLRKENTVKDTNLLKPLEGHKLCRTCGESMDHFSGYYRRAERDPKTMMLARSHTSLQTHTGINRDWGVVEEGILYDRQIFKKSTRFWGMVKLPETLDLTFQQFVTEVEEVRIGTGRTRGLGRVTINVGPLRGREYSNESKAFALFNERLATFSTALKTLAERAEVKTLAPFYFAITLYAPTILCDPWLRYHSTLAGETLDELIGQPLGYPPKTFKRIYQSTAVQCVAGWNELWGTPRVHDYAMETGSVFLFSSAKPQDDALTRALYQLEEDGIGRRRAEGFGRICISDSIHLEGEQR